MGTNDQKIVWTIKGSLIPWLTFDPNCLQDEAPSKVCVDYTCFVNLKRTEAWYSYEIHCYIQYRPASPKKEKSKGQQENL